MIQIYVFPRQMLLWSSALFASNKTSIGAESRAFMPEEIDQSVTLKQGDLNDLTPDPNLSKESALLLVSRRRGRKFC
ncbi:hypothetical protein PoB_005870500 [Plakobranchus ocellatus]|uniref:Uncharacterized protein n=1 Tax=Plakobranchus ocellatus TaxID=259542 RepID=A0AAV4CH66_9GAST|nr:hypothetical protein PoB_005870500 [Plakobranchus ocellatus]